MNDEIQVLDQLLLPLLKTNVERDSAIRHVGLSPMVLEDSKLEKFINSDPTILHYFQNFCVDDIATIGARYSPSPESFKSEYSKTDYSDHLIPAGLFMLCTNGDGTIECFNINDRKVYSMNVSWSDDNDWRESYLYEWDSLKAWVEYVLEQEDG